ncbi:MAG: DUF3347 domain-containing protein [Bacteroidales bacterium]|nr:DUF3347 domain-containing protein [Bacteroidales bacterium]
MGHDENDKSNMHSKMPEESMTASTIEVGHSQFVASILDNYLALNNALADDNGAKAASSGKTLYENFVKLDLSTQLNSKQKELGEIIEDAREHAEHISENAGDIEHQREHFEILSNDIKDLVMITGADRNLYQIFCPMYNNNKGGMWLNASSEVRNPYLGKKMPKCGSVQKEIIIK